MADPDRNLDTPAAAEAKDDGGDGGNDDGVDAAADDSDEIDTVLTELGPAVVHRILLTDRAGLRTNDFDSASPRRRRRTSPSFAEFVLSEGLGGDGRRRGEDEATTTAAALRLLDDRECGGCVLIGSSPSTSAALLDGIGVGSARRGGDGDVASKQLSSATRRAFFASVRESLVSDPEPSPKANEESSSAEAEGDDVERRHSSLAGDDGDRKYDLYAGLVAELNASIRSLVPNRKDLHGVLDYDPEVIRRAMTEGGEGRDGDGGACDADLLGPLIRAGEALSRLEAPDRASGTVEWLELARGARSSTTVEMSSDGEGVDDSSWNIISELFPGDGDRRVSFAVASAAYLLRKAELCHEDVADFKLVHVVAPMVNSDDRGIEYERRTFQERYGSFDRIDEEGSFPATSEWIRRFVEADSKASTTSESEPSENSSRPQSTLDGAHVKSSNGEEEEARAERDQTMRAFKTIGFVDDLLFSTERLALPEIFARDASTLAALRDVSRLAVAGSSLALHAANAVGGAGHSMLRTTPLPPLVWEERRALVLAMRGRVASVASSPVAERQEAYERGVTDAVVALARAMIASSASPSTATEPPLSPEVEGSLRSRAVAVLRGEDPVLRLLDSRVRGYFHTVCSWEPPSAGTPGGGGGGGSGGIPSVPGAMATGRRVVAGAAAPSSPPIVEVDEFAEAASGEARRCGLSFFAEDLTEAGRVGRAVACLAWDAYGEMLVCPLAAREVSPRR